MPRYFFDLHDDLGLTIDDAGEDLPNLAAARGAALRALAEAIRTKSEIRAEMGPMSVIVRTQIARVLTVSASIEISMTS